MAEGVNKAILVGNLGKDPELGAGDGRDDSSGSFHVGDPIGSGSKAKHRQSELGGSPFDLVLNS